MNTSEVLNKAADLIEERGWTRGGNGWNLGGPLCLEGGIMVAAGLARIGEVNHCPAALAVVDYLGPENCTITSPFSGKVTRSWVWNDDRSRTATEVIGVLRAAAVIEAAKENAEARDAVTR